VQTRSNLDGQGRPRVDDFTRIGVVTISIVAVLAVIAWVLDYVAGLLGATKAGASRQAIVGAAVGTVSGLFMGLVGAVFMPLVGAAVGEYLARRDQRQAVHVGVATWLGISSSTRVPHLVFFNSCPEGSSSGHLR
jgi:uncharacterized protein YqgC (DUF456 family)